MRLERLALANIRNYAHLEYEPSSGLNVILGRNAQGKTNLLEAIAVLGRGKSFRTSRDGEMIRTESPVATLVGHARVRAGEIRLGCTIARGERGIQKRYTCNGATVRYAGYLGKLRVVSFVPGDLALVDGPPSLRRAFLNEALSQDDPAYYRALGSYRRALAQKAAMLRGPESVDEPLLAIYDQTLIETGTILMLARERFIIQIAREAAAVHAAWTRGKEVLGISYRPDAPFEAPSADAVAEALTGRLRSRAAAERIRGMPLVGPHRDDLLFELAEGPLASLGSQGQRRTAVLALKVAEYGVMRDRAGEAPLLLLDDVLSELDGERASAFLEGLGTYEQAFVSATEVLRLPQPARVCTIAGGELSVREAP